MTYYPRMASWGREHWLPRMTMILSPFGSGLFGPPAGPPEVVRALAVQAQWNQVCRTKPNYNSGKGWHAPPYTPQG